ncbi:hypothetical protein M2387_004691 [Klebsiella sp. BIGb0407]|nr:hypothetical protein [Klebsiella sp. BIGb0407]
MKFCRKDPKKNSSQTLCESDLPVDNFVHSFASNLLHYIDLC